MKRVMVVGSSGVLGKLICTELLRIFGNTIHLVVSDYKTSRGKETATTLGSGVRFQYLDIHHKESVEQALQEVDIIIVATKQTTPIIQKVCIEQKVFCIDVTVFGDFVISYIK
ncbi:saccharopine dehydrogenase NADP-binding domain-containing protein [Lysinibacillus sp. KU-BSD001]|uniref:saccharopine dehydrogenase NADP-binding domain-containing protein n=1 Tax=Lysinibacillus sp. KU-BSD001 TaxID=3141328 RepID=UPI0036EACAA4